MNMKISPFVLSVGMILTMIVGQACETESTESISQTGPMVADERMAGEPMAGEPMAGEPMAGEPMIPLMCISEWLLLESETLKSTIYQQLADSYSPISPMTDLGGNLNRYTTARSIMFKEIERREGPSGDLGVYTIYTNFFTALAPNVEPDHSEINCEHTWPRSRLVDEDDHLYQHQQSDLHHLLPARAMVNSLRGSNYFGEPDFVMEDDFAPALSGQDNEGHTVFQPMEERRGDVARVIFYMSVRWGLDIPAHEEENLRRWHLADPVNQWEIERNLRIEARQGNRNPFIDCPELVERIEDFTTHPYAEQENLPLP